METKETQENVKKWLAYLKTTKKNQTQSSLYKKSSRKGGMYFSNGYCCLAIAGQQCGLTLKEMLNQDVTTSEPYQKVRAYLGLSIDQMEKVMLWNDDHMLTFKQIANQFKDYYATELNREFKD